MSQVAVEEDDLAYTRAMRRKMVENLTVSGEMPKDPKEKKLLLDTLDGMDRATLGKMRIEVDKDTNKQSQASQILAALFRDPRTIGAGLAQGERDKPPELAPEIQPSRILPGELSTQPSVDNFDSFASRTQST